MMKRSLFAAAALALAVAACATGVDPEGPPASAAVLQGDVEYRATTAILESFPVQLHTSVEMRNRSASRVELQLGSGCPVLLRVYKDEARTVLAWDQGRNLACTK